MQKKSKKAKAKNGSSTVSAKRSGGTAVSKKPKLIQDRATSVKFEEELPQKSKVRRNGLETKQAVEEQEKEFIQEELDSGSLVELPFDLKIPKRKIGFVTKEKNKTNEALDLFLNFYALSANKKS